MYACRNVALQKAHLDRFPYCAWLDGLVASAPVIPWPKGYGAYLDWSNSCLGKDIRLARLSKSPFANPSILFFVKELVSR